MNKWTTLGSATAMATLMAASPAFAEVTAQQVWGDMKSYMQSFGYQTSASESTSGDTLTVSDLMLSMTMPEDSGKMTVALGQITFTNNSDGTVAIDVPDVMPLVINVEPEGDDSVQAKIDYTNTGLSMIVSGDDAERTYNFTAADLGMALTGLTVDGKEIKVEQAAANLSNVLGSYVTTAGNTWQYSQTMQASALTFDVKFDDPEGNGNVVFAGAMNDLSMDGSGAYPNQYDMQDIAGMLKAGLSFAGAFAHKGGQSQMVFVENGKETRVATSSGSGSLTVAMDETRLNYAATAKGTTMNMEGGDIPFPVEIKMAEAGFNFLMPVSKGDQEQDFAFAFTLGDFTISDMIWGIFDPSGQLPRDPATIALDLSGKAKLFFDVLDQKQMENIGTGDTMPGELNSLKLNSLRVSAAGAELSGAGDFTFDNTDLESFDGMPAPTGAADMQLVGGNGLLDKLVAMGLLPEEQATGFRMMMGLFTVPGVGEDTLTSKIEINEQGQLLANGQRLN